MNFKNYIYLVALGFGLNACSDVLETEPQQSLPTNIAIATEGDLETATAGAYNALQDADLGAGALTIYPDIFADNVEFVGSFNSVQDIATQNINALNAEVNGMYSDGYTVVNQTNIIFNALNNNLVTGLSDAVASKARGEAAFIRGVIYFEMIRWFGKPFGIGSDEEQSGLIIRTEPVLTASDIDVAPRNTVTQVYDQIIADFQTAIDNLPETNSAGRATKFSAMGYMARVRFQRGEYVEAAELAKQIIDGPFSLMSSVDGFFRNEFSAESVWELVSTSQDVTANINITQFTNRVLRDGDVRASADLIANGYQKIITADMRASLAANGLSAEDDRVSLLIEGPGGITASVNQANTIVHPFKYEDTSTEADNGMPMRLAEFMLMRAEALSRTSSDIPDEALKLLNDVRLRSLKVSNATGDVVDPAAFLAYSKDDFADFQSFIETVVTERRVELAFEGNRFHDLMRLRRPTRAGGLSTTDDRIAWPIPQVALNANGAIKQNDGY